MSISVCRNLLSIALFVSMLLEASSVWAAKIPQDACQVLTAADYKVLGITTVPKSRAAETPSQSMRTCVAGSRTLPPMLSLMIQDIKLPIAVETMRKTMASDEGAAVNGPWDAGKVNEGSDGIQVHVFKGNVSILIMATNGWTNWGNAGGAAVRNTLIEVAKRIAADL